MTPRPVVPEARVFDTTGVPARPPVFVLKYGEFEGRPLERVGGRQPFSLYDFILEYGMHLLVTER
jgi:hypothetical protein